MTSPREFWEAIPSGIKALTGFFGGLGTAAVVIGAALNLPARVTTAEGQIETLQATTRDYGIRLSAQDRRADYMLCLLESLAFEQGRRTPGQCTTDYARPIP